MCNRPLGNMSHWTKARSLSLTLSLSLYQLLSLSLSVSLSLVRELGEDDYNEASFLLDARARQLGLRGISKWFWSVRKFQRVFQPLFCQRASRENQPTNEPSST